MSRFYIDFIIFIIFTQHVLGLEKLGINLFFKLNVLLFLFFLSSTNALLKNAKYSDPN